MRISPNTLIADLTPAQIAQINPKMRSEYQSYLRPPTAEPYEGQILVAGTDVIFRLHPKRTINDAWKLAEAIRIATTEPCEKLRTCRVCGCSDRDCKGCIERTGRPCRWVGPDLCSACAPLKGGES